MSNYKKTVKLQLGDTDFLQNKYLLSMNGYLMEALLSLLRLLSKLPHCPGRPKITSTQKMFYR